MGCFSTCFPKSKPAKSLRPRKITPRLDQLLKVDESIEEALPLTDINEPVFDALPHTEDVQGVKLNISGRKKVVTFDLNVKIYEGLPVQDEPEEEEKEKKSKCHSDDSSSSSSLFSFPPEGYRYQDCDSDDEFDQMVSDDESDLDPYLDDDDDEDDEDDEFDQVVKEESSESLFSLSIDSRKHKITTEKGDKEVNSPMPVKAEMKDFDSVLNPVENLTQWKAVKARAKLASQNKAKENKNSILQSNIPVIVERVLKPQKHSNHQIIAVDTSLSTWLVDTSSPSVGNSPQSDITGSPKDFEDRPILGAMTVDDINELSVGSTPRKSPSRSPDDMAIIGSVGSYWSHTGQGEGTSNTRSNCRQGRKANFNSSTAFEQRLESVL